MKYSGLSSQQVEESRKINGSNALTDIPPEPLWSKILEGFKLHCGKIRECYFGPFNIFIFDVVLGFNVWS